MEIHWHSSGSTPNQVRPGATLTLGVLLETLSVRSPLPLPPPPIGCYLAFRTGAGLVEGLAPDLGILHGMNYSWRGEDSTRLPPPAPRLIFQGFPQTVWLWILMPLSSLLIVSRGGWTEACPPHLAPGLGFFGQQLGAGPRVLAGPPEAGPVTAHGPEVCPAVGGPLGATIPVTLPSHGCQGGPPWPHQRAVPSRRQEPLQGRGQEARERTVLCDGSFISCPAGLLVVDQL